MPENKCPSLGIKGDTAGEPRSHSTELMEETIYEESGFPAVFYIDDLTYEEVAWHWHAEFEVLTVVEGSIDVLTGGHRSTLNKGDSAFINSKVLHAVQNHMPGCPAVLHAIVFHADFIADNHQSVLFRRFVSPLLYSSLRIRVFREAADRQDDMSLHLHKAIDTMYQKCPGYEILLRNELSLLLFSLLPVCGETNAAAQPANVLHEERAQAIMAFIHMHYAERIALEDIAQAVAVSPNEAMRCFGHVAGMSPVRYLKEYRLMQAAKLLKEQRSSVTEICTKCGFHDASYFAKAFREHYGRTPVAYRNGNK